MNERNAAAWLQRCWHNHWPALLLAIITIALALGDGRVAEALRYQRDAIIAGQIWRMVTGHLVHLGWPHLWLNLAGLALIWAIFGRLLSARHWMILFLFCALLISAGLLLLERNLDWYVGLSGVLHGMFVAGAVAAVMRGYRAELLLLLLLAAKLGWEQYRGPLPGSEQLSGGEVIVAAHLYGAVAGLLFMLLAAPGIRRRQSRPPG